MCMHHDVPCDPILSFLLFIQSGPHIKLQKFKFTFICDICCSNQAGLYTCSINYYNKQLIREHAGYCMSLFTAAFRSPPVSISAEGCVCGCSY